MTPMTRIVAEVARAGAAALLLAAAVAAAAQAQSRHPVSGRVIAPIMGYEGAAWLERPEREREEAPSKAIAALDIKPGQVVADVGAGSGYYTVRLAERVGPSGKVFATDIQPQMVALLQQRVARDRLTQVEVVLATETDPRLPSNRLDLIVMVDVYHELARPQEVLRQLRAALKPDGRLVLIEFRKESAWVPIREEHKMSVQEARLELEAESYRFDRVIDVLPWQHILVFRR
jgi:ubiquinone/menaquinone biosynthesis C-methylase UbiE